MSRLQQPCSHMRRFPAPVRFLSRCRTPLTTTSGACPGPFHSPVAVSDARCPRRRLGLKTKASSVGVNLLMATLIIPLPLMPDNLQVTCNARGQLLSVLPLTTMHTLLPRPQAHVLARLKDRRRDSQMVGAGRSLVGACENSTHRFRIPSYPPTVSTPQRALTNESSAACP